MNKLTHVYSMTQCVSQIINELIHHSRWPDEIKNHPQIIQAEVDVGARVFGKRGFDVIRNVFFVEQTLIINRFEDKVSTMQEKRTFDSFHEYFAFLNGDIYTSACYYQYDFTEQEIEQFDIDLSKINSLAFIESTISDCSESIKEIMPAQEPEIAPWFLELFDWAMRLNASKTQKDILRIFYEFSQNASYDSNKWAFMLPMFVSLNPPKNIPIAVDYMMLNSELGRYHSHLFTMLCIEYGSDKIFDCFPSRFHQRKSTIKAIKKMVDSGEITQNIRKYYNPKMNLFCVNKTLINTDASIYEQRVGEITYYYTTLDDFLNAVDYDLSYCSLPPHIAAKIDKSKIKVLGNVQLTSAKHQDVQYSVQKGYSYKEYYTLDESVRRDDYFYVEEIWRTQNDSTPAKTKTHRFDYFCDFAYFLKYDLSGSDLLMCDGLVNIRDFSGINLNGAIISSDLKQRAGILDKNEMFPILSPPILEKSLANESKESDHSLVQHHTYDSHTPYTSWEISYISDLHLPHHIYASKSKTKEDISYQIRKTVDELTLNLSFHDSVLIIVGDTSCDFNIFKQFVKELSIKNYDNIVFTLGNHELWDFEGRSFSEISSEYKAVIESAGMYLLQNSIIYDVNGKLHTISESELMTLDEKSLKKQLKTATLIIFGGLAFAGQNRDFNADAGLYKNTLTREDEIKESLHFEELYKKVRNAFPDKSVIIATHTPLEDWSQDIECHTGYSYINGHTHKNRFVDNGLSRVYADNQVGYCGKKAHTKSFFSSCTYDLFDDFEDGVYSITRKEYIDFYRGLQEQVTFNKDFDTLYMLKKNGYYCFIIQTDNGKLSILNKGSTKQIKKKDINVCFDEMTHIIESVKNPLDKYTEIQNKIASLIKSIGGDGRIHGAIIDIDYFNHLFVNPNDLTVTGYYAESMTNKLVYGDIENLIEDHCSHLLPAWRDHLTQDSESAIVVKNTSNNDIRCEYVPSTDIYKVSSILKKMQGLGDHVLCFWPDKKIKVLDSQVPQIADQHPSLPDYELPL